MATWWAIRLNAIDCRQTDGGAWQTVLETAVTGKTTPAMSEPSIASTCRRQRAWTLRLRKNLAGRKQRQNRRCDDAAELHRSN